MKDPRQGWVAPGWEEVRGAFERNFDDGAEIGAAFAAYHRGRKVVDLWGGVADEDSGRPWSEDTLVLVYSTTKGVTAMCAHRLADRGELDLDSPVHEYWPEFAQAGKEKVTVADLLSHRAGLAWTDGSMSLEEALAWDPVVKALEAQSPSWDPGSAHGYHATTYGWLVGEVVRRVSSRSVGTYLQEEIAGPLGAEFFIGLPAPLEKRVATLVPFSIGDLASQLDLASLGSRGGAGSEGDLPRLSESDVSGASSIGQLASFLGKDSPLLKALYAPGGSLKGVGIWASHELHGAEIPAANGICDARSLALLYAACLGEVIDSSGEPFRIFSADQLERALVQQTRGPDRILLGLDIQWGLGFMINRGEISKASMGGPRSFGHFGMGGSVGWADPDLDLAMGYVMNRMTMGTTGDTRSSRLANACVDAARKA